jgi:hypothetical protein
MTEPMTKNDTKKSERCLDHNMSSPFWSLEGEGDGEVQLSRR